MSIRTLGSSLLVYFKFSTTFTLSIPGTLRTTGIITFFAIARTSSGCLFWAADVEAVALRMAKRMVERIGCFIFNFLPYAHLRMSGNSLDVARRHLTRCP